MSRLQAWTNGKLASMAQGLDAEVLQMPGEEALAPRPRRRLLLGQRQERARAQVFDVPDALRASVKVALVEDVHCGASGRVQRLARLARLERGAGERE